MALIILLAMHVIVLYRIFHADGDIKHYNQGTLYMLVAFKPRLCYHNYVVWLLERKKTYIFCYKNTKINPLFKTSAIFQNVKTTTMEGWMNFVVGFFLVTSIISRIVELMNKPGVRNDGGATPKNLIVANNRLFITPVYSGMMFINELMGIYANTCFLPSVDVMQSMPWGITYIM
jgi:hypothetical protein